MCCDFDVPYYIYHGAYTIVYAVQGTVVLSKTTIIYALSKILCYLYHCMTTIVVPFSTVGKISYVSCYCNWERNIWHRTAFWHELFGEACIFLAKVGEVMPRKGLVTNVHRRTDPCQGSQPLATTGASRTGRRAADLTTGSKLLLGFYL